MYVNQYAVPKDYAIPNPLGPRIHNWKGGNLNEGSLFHGPNYTRPAYRLPWMRRPLSGPEEGEEFSPEDANLLLVFAAATLAMYPEVFRRIDAKSAALESDQRLEHTKRLIQCIREEAPELAAAAATLSDVQQNAGGILELLPNLPNIYTEEDAHSVEHCTESRSAGLGIILPVVGIGALLLWVFARK